MGKFIDLLNANEHFKLNLETLKLEGMPLDQDQREDDDSLLAVTQLLPNLVNLKHLIICALNMYIVKYLPNSRFKKYFA